MVFYSTKVSKFSVCFTLKAHLKLATFQVLDSPAHRGQHPLYWTTRHQRGVQRRQLEARLHLTNQESELYTEACKARVVEQCYLQF